MIVNPDFPDHWKTRALVKLTGDASAPMAVLRLWAYCQNRKQWQFPAMTAQQLASICLWGDRTPACHVALVKAGFVDKLSPRGYAAHQWGEYNAQLLQRWEAGKRGGRREKNANTYGFNETEKPAGYRPVTGREPASSPIREDQTKREEKEKTGQTALALACSEQSEAPSTMPPEGNGEGVAPRETGMRLVGKLVESVAKSTNPFRDREVRTHMSLLFAAAEQYAQSFLASMQQQNWHDRDGKPIASWRKVAETYANNAERKCRGIS
ncbi:MAG: hypothetical protein JXQ71_13850 [Verrucomicrobia bacterium]|nr:hypothetical protein [Verrucomicrobiota bacterium]